MKRPWSPLLFGVVLAFMIGLMWPTSTLNSNPEPTAPSAEVVEAQEATYWQGVQDLYRWRNGTLPPLSSKDAWMDLGYQACAGLRKSTSMEEWLRAKDEQWMGMSRSAVENDMVAVVAAVQEGSLCGEYYDAIDEVIHQ